MIRTILLALALAAGVSSAAQAQALPQQIPVCGQGVNAPDGPGARLFVDQAGNLCVSAAAMAPSSSASSAITPSTTQSSALVAKNAPGNLYGYNATAGATPGFIALLNTTVVPAASAAITPLECSAVPANGTFRARQDIADRYSAGIVLLFTSSCSTYTAVTPAVMTAVAQ